MNLNQLRAFHAVAACGSVTAGARKLSVTQPALTAQVKALESDHRAELFIRRGRGVQMTDAGRALFALSERLFDLEAQAEALLGSVADVRTGELRVGCDNPFRTLPMIARFREAYPGVNIAVSFGNSGAVLSALDRFEVDVAIAALLQPTDAVHSVELAQHRLVVVVSQAHPWAGRKQVPMKQLHGQTMLRREAGSHTQSFFDAACKKESILPEYVMEIGGREALREGVAAGLGSGVIASSEVGNDPRIRPVRLVGLKSKLPECIACIAQRKQSPLIGAFMRHTLEMAHSQRAG